MASGCQGGGAHGELCPVPEDKVLIVSNGQQRTLRPGDGKVARGPEKGRCVGHGHWSGCWGAAFSLCRLLAAAPGHCSKDRAAAEVMSAEDVHLHLAFVSVTLRHNRAG